MSKFNFTQYMHDIAVLSKDIAHVDDDKHHNRFYRTSGIQNLEEVIEKLPEFKGFALAVEDNQEGNYMMNGSGSLFDAQMCGFFLLTKAQNLSAEDRGDKIAHAELIMRKVLSKMRKDYNADNAGKTDFVGIRNMDWSSLHYFSFGPVLDNCYGVYCNFVIKSCQTTIYEPNDWNA